MSQQEEQYQLYQILGTSKEETNVLIGGDPLHELSLSQIEEIYKKLGPSIWS